MLWSFRKVSRTRRKPFNVECATLILCELDANVNQMTQPSHPPHLSLGLVGAAARARLASGGASCLVHVLPRHTQVK